jgi:hypothetical protein
MPSHLYAKPFICQAIYMPSHLYAKPFICQAIYMPSHLYAKPFSKIFLLYDKSEKIDFHVFFEVAQ